MFLARGRKLWREEPSLAQKVWQDPGEAEAKLLSAIQLPRHPLHQSISNPPGVQVPGLVPGPHLADYVLPQNFLPLLFPVKSQGGEDRVNRDAHLVQSGGRDRPAPLAGNLSARGAPAQEPSGPQCPRTATAGPTLGQSIQQGGLGSSPDIAIACSVT